MPSKNKDEQINELTYTRGLERGPVIITTYDERVYANIKLALA